MKITLLSAAVVAALLAGGRAQAAGITLTFNGYISAISTETYGTTVSDVYTPGANGLGVFGGGNLVGDTFTLTANWDPTQLNSGDYANVPEGGGANSGWVNDPTANSTFSYGITVNNQTVGDTNSSAGGLINLDLSYNGPTPPSDAGAYMGAQVYHPTNDPYSNGPTIDNSSFLIYSSTPFSSSTDSGNNIENQAYMTAFANNLCLANNGNCRFFIDEFVPNLNGYTDTQEILTLEGFSGTPEPSTWFSLATGLGAVAFLKFRRRAVRG